MCYDDCGSVSFRGTTQTPNVSIKTAVAALVQHVLQTKHVLMCYPITRLYIMNRFGKSGNIL